MQTTMTIWTTVSKTSKCKNCGNEIAFQKSRRTGKWYPTEVYTVPGTTEKFTGHNHFHCCRKVLTSQEVVDRDIQFKNAFGEAERRQEANIYRAEMEAAERREEELQEKRRQEFEIKAKDALSRLRWDERELIETKQSSYYDHTYYKVKVDGEINTALIHSALNRSWDVGVNAARYGKFGGYNSIGRVIDNGDGTVTIESIYHIGD